MPLRKLSKLLTRIGTLTARPSAFLLVLAFALAWLALSRQTLDWQGAATLATLFMTLVIQRAEHRDTQALHAKLDELLRVNNDASSDLTTLDQREPEAIERHRVLAEQGGRPAR